MFFFLATQNTSDDIQPALCPCSLRSYHHLFPILAFEELSSLRGPWDQEAPRTEEVSIAAAKSHDRLSTQHEGKERSEQSSGGTTGLSCFGCMRGLDRSCPRGSSAAQQQQASASSYPISHSGGVGGRAHASPMVLRCPTCDQVFCYECDVYIHESLHNCPGCETLLGASSGSRVKGDDV